MTENNIKELLSECFIKLMGSYKGYKITQITPDDGGIDVSITYSYPKASPSGGNYFLESGEYIHIQLKSTTEKNISINNKYVKYNLKVSNYNKLIDLRKHSKNTPSFLVVFILPESKDERLVILANHLKLKKNAYWYIPEIGEKLSSSKKSSYKLIKIPIKNRFQINTMQYLFDTYVPR